MPSNPSNNNGFTIWFTGLSGAGKTTLSHAVHEALCERGILNAEILDGDVIRTHFSKGLGFSKADRDTNIKMIGLWRWTKRQLWKVVTR